MFCKATKLAASQRIAPCAHRTLRSNLFNTGTVFDFPVGENLGWMTTYSAFNPFFSRPLPLPKQSSIIMRTPTALSKSTTLDKVLFKPWPYSLPSFLQPKDGTTFSLMNGTSTTQAKRTGVLQAILYGVPDPERFSYKRELVAPGSLLHKILYGVMAMDDGEGVVVVASITAVKGDEAIGGGKTGKEVKPVVVKNMEVRVQVEDVLEKKNDDMGQGIIAK